MAGLDSIIPVFHIDLAVHRLIVTDIQLCHFAWAEKAAKNDESTFVEFINQVLVNRSINENGPAGRDFSKHPI